MQNCKEKKISFQKNMKINRNKSGCKKPKFGLLA